MAAVNYQRFSALLSPDQVWFLEKEAERRGVSANALLRSQLHFAVATLGARVKGKAQKALLAHGLVLRRAEVLRFARQHAPDQKTAVISPVSTHSEIASRISTNREAVSRELGELRRAGLVQQQGDALVVLDTTFSRDTFPGSLA